MGNSTKKLTYEYVKNFIEEQGYFLLSDEYINSSTHLIVQCSNGHKPYPVTFNNFKRNRRCPECANIIRGNTRRLSMENLEEYMSTCEGYELLSETYQNNSLPLLFKCPKGHIFKMTWSHFSSGERCSECDITKKKTFEEVKSYIESFEGYYLLSKQYINNQEKLLIQCPEGHVFKMNYADFKSGYRCAECAGNKKKTIEEISNYLQQYNYTLLSDEYTNAHKDLLVMCPEGHTYLVTWNNFQSGKRCPVCNESKGEEKCRRYFVLQNINFQRQYSFDDCRNIELLRFDFAIFNENGSLSFLCEYDGEFHYLAIESEKKLKYQQKLDSIKNIYCQQNNIHLLRIPYWDFDNIEQILSQELIKHDLKIA